MPARSVMAAVSALAAVAIAGSCTTTAPAPTATSTAAPSPTPSPTVSASDLGPPLGLPSPEPEPTPDPVLAAFDGAEALRFATDLASLGTRDAGTPGDVAAREVIRDAFAADGWDVVEEEFALPQGGTTTNIVAVRDPADLERPHIVVGGHHDTRGGSPGANDNASGIGVLLGVAREVLDEPGDVPVVFVAFGAEEFQQNTGLHHLGSDFYAGLRRDLVLGAFIVDMVGNGPGHCICWLDLGPPTMANRMRAVADAFGLDGFTVEARGDISDHGPFARRGLPAAFLWSYNDGVLHTPRDTADRLQQDDIQRAGDLTLAFVRTLSADDLDGLDDTVAFRAGVPSPAGSSPDDPSS